MLHLLGRIWSRFTHWPIAAQIATWWLLTIVLLVPAYQLAYPMTLRTAGDDSLFWYGYLSHFYEPYQTEQGVGRPTNGDGQISLWALGQHVPIELGIRVNNTRPYGGGNATIVLNGAELRTVYNTIWRQYRMPITVTHALRLDTQVIEIRSGTWVPYDYDPDVNIHDRWGVVVDWITLKPLSSGAPTIPAWSLIAYVALLASTAFLVARRIGVRAWCASLLAASIIGFFAFLVAFFRISIQAYILPAMVIVLALLLLACLAGRRGAVSVKPGAWARHRGLSIAIVAAILVITFTLRLNALLQLPQQVDERVYLPLSSEYANFIEQGQWDKLIQSTSNLEHPVFVKLSFAGSILAGRTLGLRDMELASARMVSVVASMLLVALTALLNPIAGAALAIHSIQIRYGSQVYLEALPALTATLCVVAFERAQRKGSRWLYLSAAMLGLTAAGKYVYAVVGLAVLPFLLWRYRREPARILLYGLVSLAVFVAADPILWPDPIGRLRSSLLFSVDFTQNPVVQNAARPWWWQIPYLARLSSWDPGIPYISPDTLIFVSGFLGLVSLARHSRVYFAWFLSGLLFLLVWPTKWEQYTCILITPLCLSAGMGLTDLTLWIRNRLEGSEAPRAAKEELTRRQSVLEGTPGLVSGLEVER